MINPSFTSLNVLARSSDEAKRGPSRPELHARLKRAKFRDDGEDSIDSEAVMLPLPADLDSADPGQIFDTGFEHESPCSPSVAGTIEASDAFDPIPRASDQMSSSQVGLLGPNDMNDLRSMIEDSCLKTQPSFKFVMPWDRPGLANIFNRKRPSLMPKPVLQLLEPTVSSASDQPSALIPSASVKRGCYSDVINFNLDLSQAEVEEKINRQALEKWYVVFATGPEAWPRGFDLHAAVRDKKLDDMKLIFGNRSINTILRRGQSMIQFVSWYKSRFFHLCPFPMTPEAVEEYVQFLHETNRSASVFHGFVEALSFCEHVLGIQVGFENQPLITHKVQRILEIKDFERKEKTQARLLTVVEVEFLEISLVDEKMGLIDRVACGCILFCLYSRSRWSDLKRVYGFVQDVVEKDGKISGYIECRTRSHKTARLVSRSGAAMPLVAPVWGVTSPPWGLALSRLLKAADRPVEVIDHQPLLMAPKPDGTWSHRAVTTTEAGKWLRKLLGRMNPEAEYATAHSLKSTPLSWCAKWGLDPEVRLILGHHKTGKSSAECYGRDNLAKPLRDFDLVLQQIRTKAFVPDSTRSGMIQEPERNDPSDTFRAPPETEEAVPESSSSDDMSDESDSSDSGDADATDAVVAPKTWDPDTIMFRNKKSKVVHVVAVGGAQTFSCGIKITGDFEKIAESPFLELRKCRRCAQSRPLKTAGQVAAALDKLRKS